jgi:hypothetical protein
MRIRSAIRTNIAELWLRGISPPRRAIATPQRYRLEVKDLRRWVPDQTEFLA